MDYCKFIHYELETVDVDKKEGIGNQGETEAVLPAQWVNADIRYFDFRVLGKFEVIMLDPPWDIHMQVSL